MGRWNIGYEKRKTDYPSRNVQSTVFDDAHQHPFSAFILKVFHKKNNQCKNMRVYFFFKPIIPLFHHSNYGRSELTSAYEIVIYLLKVPLIPAYPPKAASGISTVAASLASIAFILPLVSGKMVFIKYLADWSTPS